MDSECEYLWHVWKRWGDRDNNNKCNTALSYAPVNAHNTLPMTVEANSGSKQEDKYTYNFTKVMHLSQCMMA